MCGRVKEANKIGHREDMIVPRVSMGCVDAQRWDNASECFKLEARAPEVYIPISISHWMHADLQERDVTLNKNILFS